MCPKRILWCALVDASYINAAAEILMLEEIPALKFGEEFRGLLGSQSKVETALSSRATHPERAAFITTHLPL